MCRYWALYSCHGFRGYRWKRTRRGAFNTLLLVSSNFGRAWILLSLTVLCSNYIIKLYLCIHCMHGFLPGNLDFRLQKRKESLSSNRDYWFFFSCYNVFNIEWRAITPCPHHSFICAISVMWLSWQGLIFSILRNRFWIVE